MKDDISNDVREQDARPVPGVTEPKPPRPVRGATVSIPPRAGCATPFGPTTLHARLALLRPQAVRLRPASASEA